jgi:hypothetical protein
MGGQTTGCQRSAEAITSGSVGRRLSDLDGRARRGAAANDVDKALRGRWRTDQEIAPRRW